jgi:hypothetical protein
MRVDVATDKCSPFVENQLSRTPTCYPVVDRRSCPRALYRILTADEGRRVVTCVIYVATDRIVWQHVNMIATVKVQYQSIEQTILQTQRHE